MATKSPLAPAAPATLPPLAGVRIGTCEAGIKSADRKDLMVMDFAKGTTVAGVVTKSMTASSAVEWCKSNLSGGSARGLVVNSGNANAFTGMKGRRTVDVTVQEAARHIGCRPEEIFVASTGVIGEPLDPDKFQRVLGDMIASADEDGWQDGADAIMTTDTFPKVATASALIDGVTVKINGMAKGSGMIAPDMATMLAFVATDAPLEAPVLNALLKDAVDGSFNAITVDGDTSTSDTVLLFATGQAQGIRTVGDQKDRRLAGFKTALKSLFMDLAHQIVRDGEGASKFVSVTVEGARSKQSAKKIALSIANSPLVKTAIAGEDANWGRVVMAVGKAGEPADRDLLSIWFGETRVALEGERDPAYDEAVASDYMKNETIAIRVDIGLGNGVFTAYTCDFTHGYISINADYRS